LSLLTSHSRVHTSIARCANANTGYSRISAGKLFTKVRPESRLAFNHPNPFKLVIKGKPVVKLHTNFGEITIELDAEKAPITVKNFLEYVESGFFSDLIFHRVIDGFMIQGGGFDASMKQKSGNASIKNEANNGLKNDKYTIAMARTPAPDSASSQFFINLADNDFLNFTSPTSQGWGYAVFGKVTSGTEVVDKIAKVKTGSRSGHQDVPVEPVIIERAEVI